MQPIQTRADGFFFCRAGLSLSCDELQKPSRLIQLSQKVASSDNTVRDSRAAAIEMMKSCKVSGFGLDCGRALLCALERAQTQLCKTASPSAPHIHTRGPSSARAAGTCVPICSSPWLWPPCFLFPVSDLGVLGCSSICNLGNKCV